MRVLELFSGIGGMHFALKASGLGFTVQHAIDINDLANLTYAANFPSNTVRNSNILGLTSRKIARLKADTILMSPPCQPYSRNGHFKDLLDTRADPFVHVCQLIEASEGVKNILMENVKGFEKSEARELFLKSLRKAGYHFREFILTPTLLGVPNTRHRYYLIARKERDFDFPGDQILTTFPGRDELTSSIRPISEFLDAGVVEEELLLPDKMLQRFKVFDICTHESRNSMCFTKAYTHYAEGTGSIYCPGTPEEVRLAFKVVLKRKDCDVLEHLRPLRLRYFAPSEVTRLMCFPSDFVFPKALTERQKYRLLGNSINVSVVAELIKLLMSE